MTASCVFISLSKSLTCIPATYDSARRPEKRMSRSSARSSELNRHRRRKNGLAAKVIVTSFDSDEICQIDVAPEDLLQLLLHVIEAEQGDPGVRRKSHQHIHIAVRPELLRPRDAPEQRELRHL